MRCRRRADATGPVGLWRKLDAARNAAKAIEKNGQHHGADGGDEFAFARIEDVAAEAKRVLSDNGLLVVPAAVDDHRSWRPDIGLVLKVEMEFRVIDVDTGESVTLPWIGYGSDRVGDKAVYMGISGAKKYFLASLLEIPFVGIDPEQDEAPASSRSVEADRVREKQDRDADLPDSPSPEPSDLPAPDMEGLVHA
jgi:hypothetical protein